MVNTYLTFWYFEALNYTLKNVVRDNVKQMSQIKEENLWRVLSHNIIIDIG